VFSPGCSNSRLINWDNSSVRVSHETTIESGRSSAGIHSSINSLGEEVVSTGSSHCRLINRHNSSVGVSNQGRDSSNWASIGGRGSGVGDRGGSNCRSSSIGNSWSSSNNWGLSSIDSSLGGEVFSTGSSNSRLINRHNSTIGVSNKLGVQVEGSSVSIGGSIGSRSSSIGNSRSSSHNWDLSSIDSSLGSKVLSTGSSNSRLVNRGDSAIGVSNQLAVEVERTRVTIGRGIGNRGSGVGSDGWGSRVGNSWGRSQNWGLGSIECPLGIEVFSTSSCNSWLINRNNSSVRMGNQLAVEVEGSRVAIGWGIGGRGSGIGGNSWGGGIADWAGNSHRCSSIELPLGSEVLSPGGGNSWFV